MHQSCLRFTLAALLCGSTSVFAQTAPQPPAPQPATPATASSGDLVLTGCLRGSAAAIGTSPGQGMIYTLEVVEVPPAKPSPSAPTGAVRSDAPTTITYTLSAPDSVGLAKHVDHEVQLTGSMQPPAAKPAIAGAAGSSSAPATGKPGGAHRTVQVSALKMISTNCPKK